jgi:hypothetical protein
MYDVKAKLVVTVKTMIVNEVCYGNVYIMQK